MNAIKSLIFLFLIAGIFAIYLPLFVLTDGQRVETGWLAYLAIPIWLAGAAIVLWCFWAFTFIGRGTPAPIDPPKELVIRGLYRYVRNPIYIGVLLLFSGHFLWFGRLVLISYIFFAFLAFHLFVLLYEEPTLRAKFGRAYDEYCRNVPRWLPRFTVDENK